MAESTQCQAPQCRRRVRPDYAYFPYCYDHRSKSFSYKDVLEDSKHLADQIERVPSLGGAGQVKTTSEMMSAGCGLDTDDCYIVARVAYDMSNDLGDLSTPNNSVGVDIRKFGSKLAENGMDPRRISYSKLSGLTQLNPFARKAADREIPLSYVEHDIVVIDRGRDSETVVDPSISSVALSWKPDSPIEEEYESGTTPYADVPWAGGMEEYLNNGYVWFDYLDGQPVVLQSEILRADDE